MQNTFKRLTAIILAASLMLLPAGAAEAATRPKCCDAKEWEVLRQTNEKRMAEGLDPVSTFEELQDACGVRAKELTSVFSHTRPDGTDCFTALEGIQRNSSGENIAAGYPSATATVKGWWESPGHKANMLKEVFNHMGVGYKSSSSDYKHYWVQMFTGGGCSVDRIVVNQVKEGKTYKKGTSIKNMKRFVKVVCDHGISYMPLSAKMCSGYDAEKKGEQTITVTYKDMETTFDVVIQ